jgi:hypothetical protein
MKMMRLTWIWILLLGLVTATSQAGELVRPSCPDGPMMASQSTAAKMNGDGAVGVLPDGEAQGGLTLVQSSGRGSKYSDKSGKFIILSLKGTFREMGRQYGALLSEEIRKMHAEILRQYALNEVVIPGERLVSFSKRLFRLYPARFKEQARGISEGGNIGLDTLAINSEFFDYFLKFKSLPGKGTPQDQFCSAISAWGPYTRDGSLIMGRDFDFPPWFKNFTPYLTLAVFNPTDGSIPTALLTYAGQIGAIQAFNRAGFVLENNDGSSYGDMKRYFGKRIPFLVKLPQMAFDCASFTSLDAEMLPYRIHYPLVFNFASPSRACVYEVATDKVTKREAEKEGLLVGVNHFLNPSWPELPTENREVVQYSALRQKNLSDLAEKNKGKIDEIQMMSIMDVLVPDGGATPLERNIYRFVADPELKRWWIKAPDYFEWTRIDLDMLFR